MLNEVPFIMNLEYYTNIQRFLHTHRDYDLEITCICHVVSKLNWVNHQARLEIFII